MKPLTSPATYFPSSPPPLHLHSGGIWKAEVIGDVFLYL